MKRSRIFLGLTTVCLAIAGVVAAKANNFGSSSGFYLTVTNHIQCNPIPATTPCLRNDAETQTCLTAGNRPFYTANDCQTPLHYRVA